MNDIFKLFEKIKSPREASAGSIEYIVAGLGNPGREYEYTRHNAGFLAADKIAEDAGVKISRLKFKSLTAEVTLGGHRCLLMKPSTYMNLSGQAVCEAMEFYKLPPEKLIVLFDDVSLEPGKIRIRRKGSDGGHNGIKNIIYLSGSDNIMRVKIGVGKKPDPRYNLADWVLSKFTNDEFAMLEKALCNVSSAVSLMVNGNIDLAMNRYNS